MEKLHKNANLTNFKQLNYPYTIKIAPIKRNQTEQHHFKKEIIYKEDLSKQLRNITSKFHRQMALNSQFSQRKAIRKRSKKQQLLKEKHHTSIPKRRNSSKLRTITSISL